MSEGCVDLTSDPELEPTGVVQRNARHTGESLEFYWLIIIESYDKGIKRKRNEPVQRQEKEPDSRQPADNPLPQISSQSTSLVQQSAVPQAAKMPVPADEDDDLCVELNFTKKAQPFVKKASMASEVTAHSISSTDAALGSFAVRSASDLAWPPSSQQSLQDLAAAAEDDEVYDVPDDYIPQAQGAGKAGRHKARQDSSDDAETELTKEARKARAAEAKEKKKAEAAAEKERKKLQREQEKAAKLTAKEVQKQEKQKEKVENRASKGYYALQEITAVLDTELVKDPLGSAIMDKLRSCTGKATAPCSGIQFEVQTNPMKPCKSIVWRRCSVPEPGRAVEAEDAEDVPYVLLYFTAAEFVAEVEKDWFQSIMRRCAELHPDHTLGLMVDKLDGYLKQQDGKGYREKMRNGMSTAGGFRRGKTDEFLADLAVRWPGVRHMLAVDPHQAAEHVLNLTIALGLQPYKAQETWLYAFGGTKDTPALRTLLVECDMPHKDRQGWFHALAHVPSVAPGMAHGIACQFPSMGALLATCMDPCKDKRDTQKLIENLTQHTAKRVGPMAARKLIGFLTSEDPLQAMDDFAKA
ncbi:MAG: crossover junction endonuclease EME1B-like [Trebouxia sp. A1-2]|nr:MAG: crossover junction endonuclease EME1B-like [Trebouxia sp. A1-2]